MHISVVMIAFNEERGIAQTLFFLKFADEIIVVDSGSTDKTMVIAKSAGARVFQRKFDHFSNQKNYALSLASHDWILSIDADEIVTPALAEEIKSLDVSSKGPVGYLIKRRNYFLGRPLNHAEQGNEYVLRLFEKKRGQFAGMVHEKLHLQGPVEKLNGAIEHRSIVNLNDYFKKLELYTDLEADRMIAENRIPSLIIGIFGPPAKWFLNYVFRAGFLDGWHGALYHALSSYYGWVKYFKVKVKKK